ncbi:MAG: fumarylacetoacetate hydrolase family protein [Propionibacteriaceae bacterium]
MYLMRIGAPSAEQPVARIDDQTDVHVRIPRGSNKPDWEVELGIVIGRRTSDLDSVDEARDAIAGYVVGNDVSERAFQLERNGQWAKGKSAETLGLNPQVWLQPGNLIELCIESVGSQRQQVLGPR